MIQNHQVLNLFFLKSTCLPRPLFPPEVEIRADEVFQLFVRWQSYLPDHGPKLSSCFFGMEMQMRVFLTGVSLKTGHGGTDDNIHGLFSFLLVVFFLDEFLGFEE